MSNLSSKRGLHIGAVVLSEKWRAPKGAKFSPQCQAQVYNVSLGLGSKMAMRGRC